MKIGVLACNDLGLSVLKQIHHSYNVKFVMTDKNSSGIVSYCIENNLDYFAGNPRGGKCESFLTDKEIDVLISVNYIFIIEKDLISMPKKLAFNLHGALLPKYRGRTPHVWAIINNENHTGITAHVINKECDAGDIIEQVVIPIENNDTGAIILDKFSKLYFPLIQSVLSKVEANTLSFIKQNPNQATFFGKRTPDDGQINWNWHKERIYNWVRAQAYPYPGAFTVIKNKKIIIDKIGFSDYGFENEMPNGLIIKIQPNILVKSPNGVIELLQVRNITSSLLNDNEIFDSPC